MKKKRRVGHAEIITSSPYKTMLGLQKKDKDKACKKLKLKSKDVKQAKQRETMPTSKVKRDSATVVDRTPCMFCEILHCESTVSWYKCKNSAVGVRKVCTRRQKEEFCLQHVQVDPMQFYRMEKSFCACWQQLIYVYVDVDLIVG